MYNISDNALWRIYRIIRITKRVQQSDGYKIKYPNQLHFHNEKIFRKHNFHKYSLVTAKVR